MNRFTILTAAVALGAGAASAAAPASDFAKAMGASMDRMMAGMSVPSSGDVDRDFVNMMVPHHQGAIDMAIAELRYGSNPQLRRIAQEIIVEQQQEIAAMRLAVGDPLPAPAPAPTRLPETSPAEGTSR